MKIILNDKHLLNEVNSWPIAVVTVRGRKEDCLNHRLRNLVMMRGTLNPTDNTVYMYTVKHEMC